MYKGFDKEFKFATKEREGPWLKSKTMLAKRNEQKKADIRTRIIEENLIKDEQSAEYKKIAEALVYH